MDSYRMQQAIIKTFKDAEINSESVFSARPKLLNDLLNNIYPDTHDTDNDLIKAHIKRKIIGSD